MVDISFDDYLQHYGTPRHSGRYPWGSGGNAYQRNKSFLGYIDELREKGLTEVEIAKGLGIKTTELRAQKTIARNQVKAADIAMAERLKAKQMSNEAIAERMGLPGESSVRALLAPGAKERNAVLLATANMLKGKVDELGMVDVGAGVSNTLGISETKLNAAIEILKQDGYVVHTLQVKRVNSDQDTRYKVLAQPGTEWKDVIQNRDKIQMLNGTYTEDSGRTWANIKYPSSVDSKRIAIRYAEDGGAEADGVVYIRPGVADLSLGGKRYAQVRILVDGTHYIKGVAMYNDDMPDGVDLLFNSPYSRKDKPTVHDVLKPIKQDPNDPFGSTIRRQREYEGSDGKKHLSPINIVNEEGSWDVWSHRLSSQMLSKQSPALAEQQLGMGFDIKKQQFEEIQSLTNPIVKKKLLETFADEADYDAVHLQAAALPRTKSKLILPVPGMKDTEIYAPEYRNGEKVVLIRHPHGGTFEIPELTVNNRNPKAKKLLGNAIDAVGITAKVAEQLSGADFDGDTVLVIPNNPQPGQTKGPVKTRPPLAELKNFDPKTAYPEYPGMKVMTSQQKAREMGEISNLITDMTILGATDHEIARAERHAMVVIDAEKKRLNYKQSAIDNGITELKQKYQAKPGGKAGGAATLISRTTSEVRIPERKPRPFAEGGPIDPATGKKQYVETGRVITFRTTDPKTGAVKVVTKPALTKSTKGAETDDAFTLVSTNGTPMETVYATHANKLKALANQARKAAYETKPTPYSPSAKTAYAEQVASLNSSLDRALKNKPLERQAQLIASVQLDAVKKANPNMTNEDIKKVSGKLIKEARDRTGASRNAIQISAKEWEAIQAGAISPSKLSQIIDNADIESVKKLATPREATVMTKPILTRAKSMLAAGYTQAEVADALGIPVSTINSAVDR